MTRELPMTGLRGKGKFIIVDEEVFRVLEGRNIYFIDLYAAISNGQRHNSTASKGLKIHHLVTGYTPWHREQSLVVDHINGNKLDNRFENLRITSLRTNNMNCLGLRKNNSSGYTGVSFHKETGKYLASIKVNAKSVYLGLFDDPKEAHEVYKKRFDKEYEAAVTELKEGHESIN